MSRWFPWKMSKAKVTYFQFFPKVTRDDMLIAVFVVVSFLSVLVQFGDHCYERSYTHTFFTSFAARYSRASLSSAHKRFFDTMRILTHASFAIRCFIRFRIFSRIALSFLSTVFFGIFFFLLIDCARDVFLTKLFLSLQYFIFYKIVVTCYILHINVEKKS